MEDGIKVIFFNIAWMRQYNGNWENDKPVHGGKWIKEHGWGGEVYNFQPYENKMYGYVEPGVVETGGRQRNLDVTRLNYRPGAVKNHFSVSGVLVVWVATRKNGHFPEVVGWYEDATVFSSAQIPPLGSSRYLPQHTSPGEYFASAKTQDCVLVPWQQRSQALPPKGKGFGRSNIWYADTTEGEEIKANIIKYIQDWKNSNRNQSKTNPNYWFTTQYPDVIMDKELWVRPQNAKTANNLHRGDYAVIYETPSDPNHPDKQGKGAIATIARVKEVLQKPTEIVGEDGKWLEVATIDCKPVKHPCSLKDTLLILKPENSDRIDAASNLGPFIRNYGGKLTPIDVDVFNQFNIWCEGQASETKIKHYEIDEVQEGERVKKELNIMLRDTRIVALKKANSKYTCEICGLKYQDKYGNLGKEFIVAHHLQPLSGREHSSRTRLGDLILVCSNCHDMMHRKNPPISPERLREIVKINLSK